MLALYVPDLDYCIVLALRLQLLIEFRERKKKEFLREKKIPLPDLRDSQVSSPNKSREPAQSPVWDSLIVHREWAGTPNWLCFGYLLGRVFIPSSPPHRFASVHRPLLLVGRASQRV